MQLFIIKSKLYEPGQLWIASFVKKIKFKSKALKYYSSDRITQIVGNGLVCLIDEKTQYKDFFSNDEMIFYKDISDLSEKFKKISRDDKLRRKIAKNGKLKYIKYFNSNLVNNSSLIETFYINSKNKYLWSSGK